MNPINGVGTELITVSPTEPTSPNDGDIWIDEDEEIGALAYKDKAEPDDIQLGAVQTFIGGAESTTSTSYTDLGSVGPTVTVTVPESGLLLIMVSAHISVASTVQEGFASFEITGANSLGASDNRSISFKPLVNGASVTSTYPVLLTGLNAGSTTITMKYKTTGSTTTFSRRRITVIPLG